MWCRFFRIKESLNINAITFLNWTCHTPSQSTNQCRIDIYIRKLWIRYGEIWTGIIMERSGVRTVHPNDVGTCRIPFIFLKLLGIRLWQVLTFLLSLSTIKFFLDNIIYISYEF